MIVNEYYIVQRSRDQGKLWVTLRIGCLSEKNAREYMESLHREHPSDWYRIVRHTEEAEAGYFGKETYDMQLQKECKSRPNINQPVTKTPPRNCDRFTNWKDAFSAFYDSLAVPHPHMSDGVSAAFLNWLFDPAKEGGANV